MIALALAAALLAPQGAAKLDESNLRQLLTVRRVYVEKLGGGETAAQMRDMIIASLHSSKLFAITENPDKADAILRGSAEDLVYTDTSSTSEGVSVRANVAWVDGGRTSSQRDSRSGGVTAGDHESTRIAERRHEASASVRLVNKDGDVIWSATEESRGAKFRGASADVADKLAKRLAVEFEKAKKLAVNPLP